MRTTHAALTGIALIIGTGLFLLLNQLLRDSRTETYQATEETLVDTAHLLAAFLEGSLTPASQPDPAALHDAISSARHREFEARIQTLTKSRMGLHVYVTNAAGLVVYDSSGRSTGKDFSRWNDVRLTLQGQYGARATRLDPGDPASSVMHVAAPIKSKDQIIGVLTVVKSKSDQAVFVSRRRQQILESVLLIGGGLLLFVGAVFFWLFRPMRQLSEYAQSITSGRRPPLPRLGLGREARALGKAIESMREELEGREYAGRYIRTLTHELKSPLSAIQGAAELLEEPMPEEQHRRFLTNIRTETARAENLIRRLLRLSEVERLRTLESPEPIPVADLMDQLVQDTAALAASRQVRVQAAPPPDGSGVTGTRELLHSALLNLLENAIDFSPPGGVVDFAFTLTTDQNAADNSGPAFVISDHGPGIPDYAQSRLFERFYSLKHPQTGRRGTGLGLCFVREAALLHGAMISLTNRPAAEGSGAVAVLRFPAPP